MNIAELFVRVRGDTADLTRKMSGAEKSVERFGRTASRVLGGLGLGIGIGAIVKASADAQNQLARLEAVLKSTGGVAGKTMGDLEGMASALQKVTTFSRGETQQAMGRLLTYTGLVGDMFDKATLATLDMASAMGIDVTSAAERVGNALQYPSLALNSLTKQGFRFTEEQKNLIKSFEAVGDLASAQAIILDELNLAYGGSAKAARDTLGGALKALKNAFTDVLIVSRDSSDGVVGAINAMADAMPRVRKSLDDAFKVWSEQFKMFKRDFVVLGGVVVTTFSLMMEAAGRWLRIMTLGGWGQTWIDEAKRMRREVMAAIKDAQSGITEGFRRGTPTQHLGLSSIPLPPRPGTGSTPPTGVLSPQDLKRQQDALWKVIDSQFKSAFDNLEQVIKSWSSGVAAALQSASDRIAQKTAGVLGDIDMGAAARGGTGPRFAGPPTGTQTGFVDGKQVLSPEDQLAVDKLNAQRAEAYQKSDLATGAQQVSKMDEIKNAVVNSGALLQAAMIALGDKILIGGGGAGSRTGGGIGGLLGGALGGLAKGTIGALGLGGPLGVIAGTLLGSAIGGMFDKSERAVDSFTESVQRATASMGNIPDWVRVNSYRYAAAAPGIGAGPMDTRPSSPINIYGNVNVSASSVEELNREIRRNRTAGGLGLRTT